MATQGNTEVPLLPPNSARRNSAIRKSIKDKNRQRRGNIHRKRWHVLNSADHLAFKGWNEEAEPWSMQTCEDYIEWCHIGKLFPAWRHHYNRHTNKANLKYCENSAFVQRCVEVWQVLYRNPFVERNEVTLSIARGVYAEVALKKDVDWSTIKGSIYVQRPDIGLIPRGVLKFPEGGLGSIRSDPQDKSTIEVDTAESEEDSDSDGTRAPKIAQAIDQTVTTTEGQHPNVEGGSSSRGPRNKYPSKVRRSTNSIGLGATATTVSNPSAPPQNANNVFDFESNDEMPTEASVRVAVPQSESDLAQALCKALDLLKAKDNTIASLQSDVSKLQSNLDQKVALVNQQAKELHRLQEKQRDTITLSDMDEGFVTSDQHQLDKVVGDLTSGLIDCSPASKRLKHSSIIPTALLPTVTKNAVIPIDDVQETQDSLSFPVVPLPVVSAKERRLEEENSMLRARLTELASTYYHWKVACILSVDRSQQVAKELDKISKNFVANAPKRENGLTSWALIEDLFPENMPMVKGPGNGGVDWSQIGWDHKNQMSNHKDEKQRQLLWPKPAVFVLDHTKCAICLEPFGPEEGWALGSCVHIYHPQCLITQCLIRRRCVICSAPFHDRLYAMFNLMTYMPPSWEHGVDTTPDSSLWGRDLIWSWRQGQHDQEKGTVISQLNWETDPTEIVQVASKLMGKGAQNEGRRSFFFQCLGGYFDKKSQTFKWGRHPQCHRWNFDGQKVSNQDVHATREELTNMALLDSTYGPYYMSQTVDYLLEQHSPQTMRTLQALKDSNVLESILNANGPASRTRAKRKLEVGESSNHEHGESSNVEGAQNV